jgi:hypothetical protein
MGIGGDTILRNLGVRDLKGVIRRYRDRGIRAMIGAAALVACGLLSMQAAATLVLSPDGITMTP